MVGLYFHGWKDGKIKSQGVIKEEPCPGMYRCLFFDWFMGNPLHSKIICIDDMKDFKFYSSSLEMRAAYSNYIGESSEEFEENEKAMKLLLEKGF